LDLGGQLAGHRRVNRYQPVEDLAWAFASTVASIA
jgi:hypothetical protein